MTAHIFLSCPGHSFSLECDDDRAYKVDTVASARALHPTGGAGKRAYIVLDCEKPSCHIRLIIDADFADTVTEARAYVSDHRSRSWYTWRRSSGHVADACDLHLGACCIHHALPPSASFDKAAILPGQPTEPDALALF